MNYNSITPIPLASDFSLYRTFKYSSMPPEGILINTLGLVVMLWGATVIWILVAVEKRTPVVCTDNGWVLKTDRKSQIIHTSFWFF